MVFGKNRYLHIKRQHLVTLDIFYYLPDHPLLVQEFIWQTSDEIPELNRVHKFLNHWKLNIEASIQEILMAIDDKNTGSYRSVDEILGIK